MLINVEWVMTQASAALVYSAEIASSGLVSGAVWPQQSALSILAE